LVGGDLACLLLDPHPAGREGKRVTRGGDQVEPLRCVATEGGHQPDPVTASPQEVNVVQDQVEVPGEPCLEITAQLGGKRIGSVRLTGFGLGLPPPFDGQEHVGGQIRDLEAKLVEYPPSRHRQ